MAGLEKVKNHLKDCHGCGMCKGEGYHTPFREEGVIPEEGTPTPRCPSHAKFKFLSYSPRGRLWSAAAVYYKNFQITDDLVHIAFTCLTCGICDELCFILKKYIFKALREEIANSYRKLPEGILRADENIGKFNNPFGEEHRKRTEWATKLDLPKKGDILYFAGCYASYECPDIATSSINILREAGCKVAYLAEKEVCCGNHLIWDGHETAIKTRGKFLINAIRKAGAKEVVFSCPNCLATFKNDYSKIFGELPFEVTHIAEFMARLIDEGKIRYKSRIREKVTFHDPCRLGRYLHVYEEPRKVIKSVPGVMFVEMKRNRKWAWCCGSGASVVLNAFPDFAEWTAAERLREAKEVANVLVTACPQCLVHLKNTAERRKINIKVIDLTSLILDSI